MQCATVRWTTFRPSGVRSAGTPFAFKMPPQSQFVTPVPPSWKECDPAWVKITPRHSRVLSRGAEVPSSKWFYNGAILLGQCFVRKKLTSQEN